MVSRIFFSVSRIFFMANCIFPCVNRIFFIVSRINCSVSRINSIVGCYISNESPNNYTARITFISYEHRFSNSNYIILSALRLFLFRYLVVNAKNIQPIKYLFYPTTYKWINGKSLAILKR